MIRKILWLAIAMLFICACALIPEQTAQQPVQQPAEVSSQPLQAQPAASCPVAPTCSPPATVAPTASPTPAPTKTPVLINTPTVTPKPYQVQPNTPSYLQNFAHLDKACNWMGVAGQAFGKTGSPVLNLVVVVDGVVSGKALDLLGMTGTAHAYGSGGYELVVGDKAVVSTGPMTIQLFDLAGNTLTDPFPFNTVADCKKNLILINFVAR